MNLSEQPEQEQPSFSPITLRRSYQLAAGSFLILSIGLWLVVGTFVLFGNTVSLAQRNAGWAYIILPVLLLPTLLSYLELRSWVGLPGGSYSLIRAMERNNLTFLTGWLSILGWAALSGLILTVFVQYASRLIMLSVGWQGNILLLQGLLAAGLLLFFAITNITAARPPWRIGVWLIGLVFAVIIILGIFLAVTGIVQPEAPAVLPTPTGSHFFTAVALLVAGQWVMELMAEAGDRRRRKNYAGFLLLAGGPLLGGLLAFVASPAASQTLAAFQSADPALPLHLYFPIVIENAFLGVGEILMLAIGAVATGAAWQILGLVMLRRFQIIGVEGWLPKWLLRSYGRRNAPVTLIILQVVLAMLGVLLGSGLSHLSIESRSVYFYLAAVAALIDLITKVGVNVTAIALARHPLASKRPVRVPLYPIFPAVGAAISFLLILALPLLAIAAVIIWLAIGAVVYWQIGLDRMRYAQLGITVFQDITSRDDITSPYPVVVPVAHPETALNLVLFGAAVAQHHGGHVTVVQVVQVPDQYPLDTGRYEARQKLDVLERTVQEAKRLGVPVEGVTRLSRSISQGILDTIAEEGAKLVVLGWNTKGLESPRPSLGRILDEVLEKALCDVVVIRGKWQGDISKALVPVSGGPHAPHAAEIALALTSKAEDGQVTLVNVALKSQGDEGLEKGETLTRELREQLSEPERVIPRVIPAATPLAGILEAVEDQEIVLVGTTETSLFDHQFFGRLPLDIARNTTQLLALVRGSSGWGNLLARQTMTTLSRVMPTISLDKQNQLKSQLRKAARPTISYFILIAASALIAALGLLLNSPAVIIGAMLVAPLMSPIVAAGMGIVTGDIQTLRRALVAMLQGVLIAIFLAILVTAISPVAMATPEVLARTRPNLLDLLVALVSGAAGAYAIANEDVSEALPGVAIAAALMPPVATIGIGIALGNIGVALGSTLLFVTNLVAIIFASAVIFLLLGIRPRRNLESQRRLQQGLVVSLLLLTLLSIPLGSVLIQSSRQSQLESLARELVEQEIEQWEGIESTDITINVATQAVTVEGTIYSSDGAPMPDIAALEGNLVSELNRDVIIRLFAVTGQSLISDP
nr:amino acid permease [Anaerolineae bacterium]